MSTPFDRSLLSAAIAAVFYATPSLSAEPTAPESLTVTITAGAYRKGAEKDSATALAPTPGVESIRPCVSAPAGPTSRVSLVKL